MELISAILANCRMWMVLSFFVLIFSRSSSVITTYLSFSYSYPLMMSSGPTSLLQWLQYFLYLMRALLSLSSWLKWMSLSTVVLYRPTGIKTSPMEMEPLCATAIVILSFFLGLVSVIWELSYRSC